MNECFYCENGEKLHSLMIEICELPNSIVYLNRDQKHPGRCIVCLKEHKCEYFELSPEQNAGFFAEVAQVAKAIYDTYHPAKINYATYGDGVPHVHVHVVPKYKDGLNWGEPFDDSLPKKYLTEEEYADMIQKLRTAIEAEK